MKKFIMMLCLGLSIQATQAQVENNEDRREKAEARHKAMKVELELSEEQAEQMESINEKYRKEIRTLRQDKAENRESIMELHRKKQAEIQAVLNEKQYDKYLAMRKEHKHDGKKWKEAEHRPMKMEEERMQE